MVVEVRGVFNTIVLGPLTQIYEICGDTGIHTYLCQIYVNIYNKLIVFKILTKCILFKISMFNNLFKKLVLFHFCLQLEEIAAKK